MRTTGALTRKRPRWLNSTKSSSSEEMGPSKTPKDVLEHGRQLVRELDLEDGVDTLGRWMAHHLAELMSIAEHGITSEVRIEASQQVRDTTLRIKKHCCSER